MKQNFTIVYIVNSDFFYYNNITLQSKIIHCVCIVDQLQLDWWSVALWIRQATDDVSTFLYNVLLWQGHLYFLCVYRFCEVALVLIYKCSSLRRFLLVFSSILHSYLSPFYFWTPPPPTIYRTFLVGYDVSELLPPGPYPMSMTLPSFFYSLQI